MARALVARLDLTGAAVRCDSNDDSNRLYAGVAARGGRLVAPRKKPHTSPGHHARHPDRLRAIRRLERCDQAYEAHERHRIAVEQAFARLTNLPLGLAPLPNFVRRLPRVRRWVAAKITLYHAYRSLLLERRDSEAA